jgi:hypothetical protein
LQINKALEKRIFNIKSKDQFNELALDIFLFQYKFNQVYRNFIGHLGINVKSINKVEDIPYLPIGLFKSHKVLCGDVSNSLIFESSGTTGATTSKHYVLRPGLYEKSFLKGFEKFYGSPQGYRVLALLPGYTERSNASLTYMVKSLIDNSGNSQSGFFLNDHRKLKELLSQACTKKTLLIGVSFALLDLLKNGPLELHNTVIMETGGMKGRRKELTRAELHDELKAGFGVNQIHSEYGMTELLSQAYASEAGKFNTPPWLKLWIREINDPFAAAPSGRSGGINVIDLANLYSCSFIATSDLGRKLTNGQTEVLGRFDYSDVRGCNLMVAD